MLLTIGSLSLMFVTVALAFDSTTKEGIQEYIAYVAEKEGIPVDEALAIAKCESNFNAKALNSNGEYSVGIFQINIKYHDLTLEEARHPFLNVNYAMDLYLKTNSWGAWKNCAVSQGIM